MARLTQSRKTALTIVVLSAVLLMGSYQVWRIVRGTQGYAEAVARISYPVRYLEAIGAVKLEAGYRFIRFGSSEEQALFTRADQGELWLKITPRQRKVLAKLRPDSSPMLVFRPDPEVDTEAASLRLVSVVK